MAILDMDKILLIGFNNDKEGILKSLMHLGVVEIVDVGDRMPADQWQDLMHRDGDSQGVVDVEADMQKVESALQLLSPYDTRKKGLFAARRTVSKDAVDEMEKEQDKLWHTVNQIVRCDERLASLKNERNKYTNLIESLEPWRLLPVPIYCTGTKHTALLLGLIPNKEDVEKFKLDLEEKIGACHFEVVHRDKDQSYVMVLYHHAVEEEVARELKSAAFSKVVFKDLNGTVQDNIQIAAQAIKEIDRECERIAEELQGFSSRINELELLRDSLMMVKDRKKVLERLARTERVFILEGWVPAHVSKKVGEQLMQDWDCMIDITQPEEEEEYPVLLSNGGMAQSVESITAMYSLPYPKEIDPNVVMAPFFILFFGLMLGDAGYGLIMIAFAAVVLWKIKLEESMQKFMKLMLYCGVSTVLWGALFGGWFGIAALSQYPLWFNPVEDPEEMLRWSLLFGVIHIYVGLGVRAFNLFRHKQYLDIVLDVLIWYVFFTGFILFVLPFTPKVDRESVTGLVQLGKYLLIAGAVLIILTKGRGQKNVFMRLLTGIAGLYDLVGFMSDVLSYSRLLALGLATSVIASIVNEMSLMSGTDSILKVIGMVLILAAGHALNFSINALGAYVHSCRLQYIEFFGKFYKGGGIPFDPLKANTKYVDVTLRR